MLVISRMSGTYDGTYYEADHDVDVDVVVYSHHRYPFVIVHNDRQSSRHSTWWEVKSSSYVDRVGEYLQVIRMLRTRSRPNLHK